MGPEAVRTITNPKVFHTIVPLHGDDQPDIKYKIKYRVIRGKYKKELREQESRERGYFVRGELRAQKTALPNLKAEGTDQHFHSHSTIVRSLSRRSSTRQILPVARHELCLEIPLA